MHALLVVTGGKEFLARGVVTRREINRIKVASGTRRCEQRRRAGVIPSDFEDVAIRRFHRFPEQRCFVEPLSDNSSVAAVAMKQPNEIFETRFTHAASDRFGLISSLTGDVRPARRRCHPTNAIIAALSVQSPGCAIRNSSWASWQAICIASRKARLQLTPPLIVMNSLRHSRSTRTVFVTRTSITAH